jgi:hypothetical protein
VTRPTDAGGDGITEIFRKGALQRLSAPERLDQRMQVVGPHDWPGLATVLALLGLALTVVSSAERVCFMVAEAIRAALHKLRDNHPILGHHLATSITPETFCTYHPRSDCPALLAALKHPLTRAVCRPPAHCAGCCHALSVVER